ncbi:MAG TPA: PilZ domain-containing protein [Clostridia bacterium]|nr:PilZ domain-containing protein [Clostridia bacterium]
MEKRINSRVKFTSKAIINYNGKCINAEVDNLSLTGALVKMTEVLDINENQLLDMELLISGATTDTRIKLKCAVVRIDGQNIGVKFDVIDIDAFIFLKNIVVYNDGDDGKIMREFTNHIQQRNNSIKK